MMQIAKSLLQIQPSYIREILTAASQPEVISLAGGLPAPEQFPLGLMTPALQSLSTQPSLFQYANTAGYTPLLDFLNKLYKLPPSDSGLVCTGSQQGLDLIARAFINPGDHIVLEAPSYLGALQVFGLAQAKIFSVPQNKEGPDLEALTTLFVKQKIKLFYGVPDFHNPTGVSWSLPTRQKVAELCQQYNVGFIEDIPYRELRFSGDSLPLVSSLCPDHSLSLRSFSKIATPGIRLGLVSGKKTWIENLTKIKQAADLHSSVPMQAVLLALLQHQDFKTHLTQTRALYRKRYQCLRKQLLATLPSEYYIDTVDGGMFLWLQMPKCDVDKIAQSALNNGVAVVPSSVFYHEQNVTSPPISALRLNFTHANETHLVFAAERLLEILVA
jgi:DNA-binding transcriptional MocR family regulator